MVLDWLDATTGNCNHTNPTNAPKQTLGLVAGLIGSYEVSFQARIH